jgi:hypothetical protein
MHCISNVAKTYNTAEDIPEDLQAAVSVLSMLKVNEYVEDVGMKQDERAYWVEHES